MIFQVKIAYIYQKWAEYLQKLHFQTFKTKVSEFQKRHLIYHSITDQLPTWHK